MTRTEDFVHPRRLVVPASGSAGGRPRPWIATGWNRDVIVAATFLAAALYVTSSLWTGLRDRVAGGYGAQDQVLMEWFLAHAARSVTHAHNPLFSYQMDAPWGVNMMGQTSILGLGVPMTPVTVLFGARVSFVVLLVVALAGTAYAWYHVLSRHVVSSRVAAAIGGGFCGFAPGMISESLGHLHMVSQFLTPFIGLAVLRLGTAGRWWRQGVLLGLLITYQAFISEEVLFFTGLAVGLFVVILAVQQRPGRAQIRRFLGGGAVALAVALALLAYPLYRQFLAPQHYHGLPFPPSLIYVDLASYYSFPTNSLAGDLATASRLAHTTAEETSFYGWPLILLVVTLAAWLWLRKAIVARAAALAGLTFALLSLGYTVTVNGHATVPGPFRLIGRLPLFDLAVAARLAMVAVPFVAMLLAIGYDQAVAADATGVPAPGPTPAQRQDGQPQDEEPQDADPGTGRPPADPPHRRRPVRRYLVAGATAIAVLPIVPLPLPTTTVPVPPHFITSGAWRPYVPANRTLVSVPTPSSFALDGMRWTVAARLDFAIPRGYFLGPGPTPDSAPLYGAVPTWTSIVFDQVSMTGKPRPAAPGDDALLLADLKLWRTSVVVLDPRQAHADALRATVSEFLGPPQQVDDVWLWDVRDKVS